MVATRSVVREGSLQSDIRVETLSEWLWPGPRPRGRVSLPNTGNKCWEDQKGRKELGEVQKHQENQGVKGRMNKMGTRGRRPGGVRDLSL